MALIGRQFNNLTFYAKELGIFISRIYGSEIHPTFQIEVIVAIFFLGFGKP